MYAVSGSTSGQAYRQINHIKTYPIIRTNKQCVQTIIFLLQEK